jgi:hypothetical protein
MKNFSTPQAFDNFEYYTLNKKDNQVTPKKTMGLVMALQGQHTNIDPLSLILIALNPCFTLLRQNATRLAAGRRH